MSADINLLLRKDEETLRQKKRITILNFVAISFVIGVGLISLIIFLSIRVINLSSIKKQQEDVLRKTSQFQDKQAKLFVLNNRVENIDRILKTRKDLAMATSSLLAKIPSGFVIDGFEVDGASVILTGQSNSLFVIGELIDSLTDMVHKKEIIKSLTLNSLALDGNKNAYLISIRAEL